VVNNAGICFIGNVEIMSMEDIDKVVAVNFLGPLYVSRTFLPILRRGRGRLINVASNAGKSKADKTASQDKNNRIILTIFSLPLQTYLGCCDF